MGRMTAEQEPRVVSASREIAAGHGRIFELIADPAQQPRWDGNNNLATAPAGQRVRRAGDVFTMTLKRGGIRENYVVEFEEGRLIAWMPAPVGRARPGHLWRWELEPHACHAHLRLDPADRPVALAASPQDHRRLATGIDGPARCPRRATVDVNHRPGLRVRMLV